MKRLSATLLALALASAAGAASAQSYGNSYGNYGSDPYYRGNRVTNVYPDRYGNSGGAIYDYARVLRVDPVIDTRYGGTRVSGSPYGNGQRCYTSAGRDGYADRYGRGDGYYGNDGYYRNDGYGSDPYYPQQGRYGTETGRTVATVIGGIAGAVLGSKVGGGSGQVAATAIGSMVGGLAGRQIYETQQRRRYGQGSSVTVCDPVPADGYGSYSRTGYGDGYNNGYVSDGRVVAYDVTYEYAGRQFVTRTNYHPGDRIRVRVDVRPE